MPASVASCVKVALASMIPTGAGYQTMMVAGPQHCCSSPEMYFKYIEIPDPQTNISALGYLGAQKFENRIKDLIQRVLTWWKMRSQSKSWKKYFMKTKKGAKLQQLKGLVEEGRLGQLSDLGTAIELILELDGCYTPKTKFFEMSRNPSSGCFQIKVQTVKKIEGVVYVITDGATQVPEQVLRAIMEQRSSNQDYQTLIRELAFATLGVKDADVMSPDVEADYGYADRAANNWLSELARRSEETGKSNFEKFLEKLAKGKSNCLRTFIETKRYKVLPVLSSY